MQNVPISIVSGHPIRSAGAGLAPTVGPAEVWATKEIRLACARRDVARVYRMLNSAGVSQRQLAAATGQAQSDISEILRHGRIVCNVYVLERIATGLGTPRSWWGLAFDPDVMGLADDQADASTCVSAAGSQ